MGLECLCKRWLSGFGHRGVTVRVKGVLKRSPVDLDLGIVGVEFDFFDEGKWLGDATAFFPAEDVFVKITSMNQGKARAEI